MSSPFCYSPSFLLFFLLFPLLLRLCPSSASPPANAAASKCSQRLFEARGDPSAGSNGFGIEVQEAPPGMEEAEALQVSRKGGGIRKASGKAEGGIRKGSGRREPNPIEDGEVERKRSTAERIRSREELCGGGARMVSRGDSGSDSGHAKYFPDPPFLPGVPNSSCRPSAASDSPLCLSRMTSPGANLTSKRCVRPNLVKMRVRKMWKSLYIHPRPCPLPFFIFPTKIPYDSFTHVYNNLLLYSIPN